MYSLARVFTGRFPPARAAGRPVHRAVQAPASGACPKLTRPAGARGRAHLLGRSRRIHNRNSAGENCYKNEGARGWRRVPEGWGGEERREDEIGTVCTLYTPSPICTSSAAGLAASRGILGPAGAAGSRRPRRTPIAPIAGGGGGGGENISKLTD